MKDSHRLIELHDQWNSPVLDEVCYLFARL